MTEYEPGATCHSPRKTQLYISYKILQYFAAAQIVDSVPKAKIWKRRNSFRCADEIERVSSPKLTPPLPHVKKPTIHDPRPTVRAS